MRETLRAKRGHLLLTKELEATIPATYSTEATALADKLAVAKFFSPYSNWTWYVLEGERIEPDGDWYFFGWVEGLANELGYFALSELETTTVAPFGGAFEVPAVERDTSFEPTRLGDLTKEV